MLATIVLPVIDLRDFEDMGPGRLTKPRWPQPSAREFVRSIGPIARRPSGGVPVFGDEDLVCKADHAIRLSPFNHAAFAPFVRDPRMKCVFRRFFHNGAGAAKFEIGIGIRSFRPTKINEADALSFFRLVAGLRANVLGAPDRPLVKLGGDLASAYFRASSAAQPADLRISSRVFYGEPMIFVDARMDREYVAPPRTAVPIKFLKDPDIIDEFSLFHCWLPFENLAVRTWLLFHGDTYLPEVRKISRFVRVTLNRIHVERQFLAHSLALIESGELAPRRGSPAHKKLRSALDRSFKRLNQPRRSSTQLATRQLYPLVLSAEDNAIPGTLDGFRERLNNLGLGPTIKTRIIQFVQANGDVLFDDARKIQTQGGDYIEGGTKVGSVGGNITLHNKKVEIDGETDGER